jgi:hypothetical protein
VTSNGASGRIDHDALRILTEERRVQSQRLMDTTRDARAWEDYRRAVRYFEDVLALIDIASALQRDNEHAYTAYRELTEGRP